MPIREKDLKLLWGRSADRCAICKIKLSQDSKQSSIAFPIGEHAHIVAETDTGPRGQSTLTINERNYYSNLILLCPTDHTRVDKDVSFYPVEKLHLIKTEHEMWVDETLAGSIDKIAEAASLIYANLVDAAVRCCYFENWSNWTENAYWGFWSLKAYEKVEEFRDLIARAVWPGTIAELEFSLRNLSIVLYDAYKVFCKQDFVKLTVDGTGLQEDKYFRKLKDLDDARRLEEKFSRWQDKCKTMIAESTKAANWVGDVVRRDVNPMFFAQHGKFAVPRACRKFCVSACFRLK